MKPTEADVANLRDKLLSLPAEPAILDRPFFVALQSA